MAQRWYQDGLRFECTQCGVCCSGEPGHVWVGAEEIAALCKTLEMDEPSFRAKFVRKVGARYSLIEHADGDCVFLDPQTRRCSVYQARPIQCRTWPFWNSNLRTKGTWEETCRVCPGAGQGKLVSIQQIESARLEKRV